jgi:hypothetical protein
MPTEDETSTGEGGGPAPLQRLDYPSPALSPFDRPVEPVVRVAQSFRLAVRIVYWVFAVAAVAFGAWAILRLLNAFDSFGR